MKAHLDSIVKNVKPLCLVNNCELIVSKGSEIFIYDIDRKVTKVIADLSVSFIKRNLMKSKLLTRLLRLGFRYGISLNERLIIVVFNKTIFEIDLQSGSTRETLKLKRGNSPLSMTEIKDIKGFKNGVVFGEYFSNFSNDEVHIYQRTEEGNWDVVYSFSANVMEHIHAIIPDKYNDCLWILAGDFGDASCIWMAKENFSSVVPILKGDQKFRSCVAFPTEEGLVYATDSQFETNTIRLLTKKSGDWESLEIFEINGSSIYGCSVGNNLCFSTAVEGDSMAKGSLMKYFDNTPGPGIKSPESHIILGNMSDGFQVVLKRKKDVFPFLLFQFGTFMFPTGENISDRLICYDVALKGSDMNTYIYNIK